MGKARLPAGKARIPMGKARIPAGISGIPRGKVQSLQGKPESPRGTCKSPRGFSKSPGGLRQSPWGKRHCSEIFCGVAAFAAHRRGPSGRMLPHSEVPWCLIPSRWRTARPGRVPSLGAPASRRLPREHWAGGPGLLLGGLGRIEDPAGASAGDPRPPHVIQAHIRHRSTAQATLYWDAYPTPGCRITLQDSLGGRSASAHRRAAKTPRPEAAFAPSSMILTCLRKRRRIILKARRLREMAAPPTAARLGSFGA